MRYDHYSKDYLRELFTNITLMDQEFSRKFPLPYISNALASLDHSSQVEMYTCVFKSLLLNL